MVEISRARYVQLYGPTVGDRIRLADTNLLIEVTEDRCGGPEFAGDEMVFGGGKVIRESMGQSRTTRALTTTPHDAGPAQSHDHEVRRALPRLGPGRSGSGALNLGDPVGSGKTALVAALCRTLAGALDLAVITNDIYTTEDADFLRSNAVLPDDRIEAVQTGCCPHTAIRDDISANLDAAELLEERHPGLELLLIESGGDNLTATFSYGLVDAQVFVLDVAGGDKVPRKGGPGVTSADLLVVNKTDLAPYPMWRLTPRRQDEDPCRGRCQVGDVQRRRRGVPSFAPAGHVPRRPAR